MIPWMFDGQVPHGPEGLNLLAARFLSITVKLGSEEQGMER